MQNIFYIRHAEYDNPDQIYPYHLPVTLSDLGRKKAAKIGEWLNDQGFAGTKIYTSPIVRCVQTAEIIAGKINSSVAVDNMLIEVADKKLQGKRMPKLNDWGASYQSDSRESLASVLSRTKKSFQQRVAEKKNSISITHGDSITFLYYILSDISVPKTLANVDDYVKKGEVLWIKYDDNDFVEVTRHKPW